MDLGLKTKMFNFRRKIKIVKALPTLFYNRVRGTPIWAHFFLTRKCNLNCKYCYVVDNNKRELSTKGVKRVIDKLHSMGIRLIAFCGGEPTIRKDFPEILEYANKKGIITYFTTNGVLLNKEYIDELARTGVDMIELSIDSIIPFEVSKKDYSRSKEVLDLLLKAREKYGFGLKTNLVITKKNLDSVVDTIKLVNDYGIPMTVALIGYNLYNNKPEDESLYFTDKKSKAKLIRLIDELIQMKNEGAKLLNPVVYYEKAKDFVNGEITWDCKAGKYNFAVDCDGSVILCAFLKSMNKNVLSINRDFFKDNKERFDKVINDCIKKCCSNCLISSSYLVEHPFSILFSK